MSSQLVGKSPEMYNGQATLTLPSYISIVRHERLKLDMNPYKDKEYFLTKKERIRNARRIAYNEAATFKSSLTQMKDLKVKNA